MSIDRLARREIQALKPYQAAIQVIDTIRMNANEAPWTSSGNEFRRPLNRYPEIRPQRLREALAGFYKCRPDRLLVTRGTSEAIDLLVRIFCRAGVDNIVTTAPTFSMYRHYADVQGAATREIETSGHNGFAVDVDALLDACDSETRLIFICSPNNPTGNLIPRDALVTLLERRGDNSAIVVDEAYIEFAAQSSAVELLEKHDNLIVLRTLSKALAYAGARCGSVMAPPAVIDMLDAVQAPYALATPVVECVEDALQADSLREAEQWVAKIVVERERLIAALKRFPSVRRVWPSAANFFLVEVDEAEALLRQCKANKILLRHFGGALPDCVRISVGTPSQNDLLLKSFAALHGDRDGR
jgi:histidinol-phosphate aminotransferase